MAKNILSFTFLTLALLSRGPMIHGQDKAISYSNAANAYYGKQAHLQNTFVYKINEITLNPDSTFAFWSRPHLSCFTWRGYKGTWKRNKDTLLFFDNYQVEEIDTKVNYRRDARQEFVITFRTDKNSALKNRGIKIQYEYDYDAHLDSPEKIFILDPNNSVIIPFGDVPNLDKLSAIRIEYLLEDTEKRYEYLTENKVINNRQTDVPNIINVEFVEKPRKEIVYREIKGAVKNDTLIIVSSAKTRTLLPDYYPDIEFETGYTVNK